MRIGESGWVQPHEIVTSPKGRRVYVSWTALIEDKPKDLEGSFAPLRLVRLKRGFSLMLRPGMEFRTSPLPWGQYAPVVEITQAASNLTGQEERSAP